MIFENLAECVSFYIGLLIFNDNIRNNYKKFGLDKLQVFPNKILDKQKYTYIITLDKIANTPIEYPRLYNKIISSRKKTNQPRRGSKDGGIME